VVVFQVAIELDNVDASSFMVDPSAQLSFRTATAESMPGVFADDIVILSVEAVSSQTLAEVLATASRDAAVPPPHLRQVRVLQITTQRTRVNSQVQSSTQQLTDFCNECTDADNSYQYLTNSLNASVATGAYTTNLQAVSIANGANATAYASVTQPPVDAGYTSFIATTNPTAQPSGVSVGAASSSDSTGAAVGGVVGCSLALLLVASGCAYFFFIHSKGRVINCVNGRFVISDSAAGGSTGTVVQAATVNPMSSFDSRVDKNDCAGAFPAVVELPSLGATAWTAVN
jgi:hypothetical protein